MRCVQQVQGGYEGYKVGTRGMGGYEGYKVCYNRI